MNTAEAKVYTNQRYVEIKGDNPTWRRDQICNVIITELKRDHNFTLTTPHGYGILGIIEDSQGITYRI